MVLIEFPDRETEIKGLTVLMSRFSGKVLRSGVHIVPEPALEALTAAKISYTVKGQQPMNTSGELPEPTPAAER
jgi:hypothetical protein